MGSEVAHPGPGLVLTVSLSSQVSVLYFAKSVELAGVKDEEVTVPTSVSSQDLWRLLVQRHPRCCGVFAVQRMHSCVCTHTCNVLCLCV